MPYQPLVNPSSLAQLDQVPVGHTLDALAWLDQARGQDQQQAQDVTGQYGQAAAMRPLDLQAKQISNDTSLAQLPGIQAQSAMLQRNNTNAGIFNDAMIKDTLGKYRDQDIKRYLDEIQGLGPAFQQAATTLQYDHSPAGMAKAKAMIEKAAPGQDMWNPAWDNQDPYNVARNLYQHGQNITESSSKFNQAMSTAQLKAEAAARLLQYKQESMERIATQRVLNARAMKDDELKTKRELDKPTYEQLSARWTEFAKQARADGRMDEAAEYEQEAQRTAVAASNLGIAKAAVPNQGKVDITGVTGLPTVNPDRSTSNNVSPLPSSGAVKPKTQPTNPQEAQQAGWVLHTDKNGNKAYVAPNGKDYIEVK